MDKSKWEIYFHNLLGIKWHMQTGGNAVLSGQQKQQNVVVVATVIDYDNDNEFSPHSDD